MAVNALLPPAEGLLILACPLMSGGLGVVLCTFLFRRCPGQTRNAQKSKSKVAVDSQGQSPKAQKVEKSKSGNLATLLEKSKCSHFSRRKVKK